MEVYHYGPDMPQLPPSAVAVGMFDGLHLGHEAILDQVRAAAEREGLAPVVLTFHPHPRTVLGQDAPQLLMTLDEKIELLSYSGFDALVVVEFTPAFAALPAEHYVRQVLINKLNTKHILVGYDHRFGANRAGGLTELRTYGAELGFVVTEVPAQLIDDAKVSSTRIREALLLGDVAEAKRLLGRGFMLNGVVQHGDKLGRTLGWPTANIQPAPEKLIPAHGVYACTAIYPWHQVIRKAAVNIGTRPTVGGTELRIEAYLLDFDGDLYDHNLMLVFHERIREDRKLNSLDELKAQIGKDVEAVRQVLYNQRDHGPRLDS